MYRNALLDLYSNKQPKFQLHAPSYKAHSSDLWDVKLANCMSALPGIQLPVFLVVVHPLSLGPLPYVLTLLILIILHIVIYYI